jgi:phosphatidate phosphatase PAH1
VQRFKGGWLNEMKERVQVSWVAAYGNASTDISAYADAGIPKERTFIIGPHAGEGGTVAIQGSYENHLSTVEQLPDGQRVP